MKLAGLETAYRPRALLQGQAGSRAKSTSARSSKGLGAADRFFQMRAGIEQVLRSPSQHEGESQCACCLQGCANPFYSRASVVTWMIFLSGASSIVHPASPTSAASRTVSADISGASPNPFP
jgi:hypothetical protein